MSIECKGWDEDDSKSGINNRITQEADNKSKYERDLKQIGSQKSNDKCNLECQFLTTETRIKPAGTHRGTGSPSW